MTGRTVAGIVAVLTLIAGLVTVNQRQPDQTYEVNASFPTALGVFPRSTVRVLGVEVGRVSEVVPDGDRVRVRMAIDEDVRVPRDALAVIVPISLIADRYIQLAPAWIEGPYLRDGDEIPLERGIAPAELDDLLATLHDFLEAIEPGTPEEPGALGRLIQNADQALAGRGEELGATIESLAVLLDVLGRNAESFDRTLVSLDGLVGSLARRDQALAATNRGLASVFSVLAEEQAALQSGITNLADLVDEVGGVVRTHRSRLEQDLATLAEATDAVLRQREGLVRNILWLPVLAEGAVGAFDEPGGRVRVRDNQQVRAEP